MANILVALAASGAALTVLANTGDVSRQTNDAAAIRAVEEEWNNAIKTGSRPALERIMAPEFKLMNPGKRGAAGFTLRAEWLNNLSKMKLDEYNTRVVDVVVAGKTAVATVEGNWRVSLDGRARANSFVVSDTWVRRNGRWSVLYRHATTVQNEIPPAPTR